MKEAPAKEKTAQEVALQQELEEKLDALRLLVAEFPTLPGVYLMRNAERTVIYVGKAKDLRARVRTYFAGGDGRCQIRFLLKKIASIDKIVTENESQAFVLERDLILKYKPKYNIKLKDDKAYLSIRVDVDAPWPRLELVRKVEDDGARYYGPYSFSYQLRSLLEIIKRSVPLRTCTNTIFHNRQRPCLEYQIKRCAGPCCLPVDPTQYRQWVKEALQILEGKSAHLISDLTSRMEVAAENLQFEDAALLRDRIEVLDKTSQGQRLVSIGGEHRDVFALYREESLASLSVLKVRSGRMADGESFTFPDVHVSDDEVLESVVSQFYENGRDIPAQIVVPFHFEGAEALSELLSQRRGAKTEILVPERGLKVRLLQLAQVNAQQHFSSIFNSEDRYNEIAKVFARMCSLTQIPRKIECIDISNFQGSDIVGGSVAFKDGMPVKKLFRKYKIASVTDKPDDFASIYEVVSRRLRRGMESDDLPDVLIIDGGPGQLRMALQARAELGASVDIVSLAKMRTERDVENKTVERSFERIYLHPDAEPITLDPASPVTHLVTRIRDEAHEHVISFHRFRRSKRVFKSQLDDISGIGPDRRARLLQHFGSTKKVAEAAEDEIARVGRMPLPLAVKVKTVLNGTQK